MGSVKHFLSRTLLACLAGGLPAGVAEAQIIVKLQPSPLVFVSNESISETTDSHSGTITVSGVANFNYTAQITKTANNYNWLTVTRNGPVLNVTATQTVVNGVPKLPKGEYTANILITSGTASRTVPVQFQIFPNVTVQLNPPSPMIFPAKGSFAPQTLTADAVDSQNNHLANGIQVTPNVDNSNPESASVSVTTLVPLANTNNPAKFSISVDSNSFGPGDHAIAIYFTNQLTGDQVVLLVDISNPIPPMVTVSGTARGANGQPLPGVQVQFSGGPTVSTDFTGGYTASVPVGYSGTETASLTGYAFVPPSYTFSNLATNVTGNDFVGSIAIHTVSGFITTAQGFAMPNVQIAFTGAGPAFTDANGYYSETLPTGYTGTATPALGTYVFSPSSRPYNNLASDFINENYTASQPVSGRRISGMVLDNSGAPVTGVTIAFSSGPTVSTDTSGAYAATESNGYSGTATPSLKGYTFSPPSISYNNVQADLPLQNYRASKIPSTLTVSGTVRDQSGAGLANVILVFSNGPVISTAADGTYSAVLNPGYSGSVTPWLQGYSFVPSSRSYSSPGVFSTDDYTATLRPRPMAEMISPPPGSSLTGPTVTFQWSPGNCITQYYLAIGTQPAGTDLLNTDPGGNTKFVVNNLPTNGQPIYVRLYSNVAGIGFQYYDYVYTAASFGLVPTIAAMITPSSGASLSSSTATFLWTSGSGISQYYLAIGARSGGNDLLNQDQGTGTLATIAGLPTDGSTLYVRLFSRVGNDWFSNDYVYTAASGPGAGKAGMITPPNRSAFCSSSAPLQWTSGTNVAQYYVAAGSSFGGHDIANQDFLSNTNGALSGLPVDGSLVYLRLYSRIGDSWYFNDYVYAASSQ